jgi:RNA polymerase sigma factor (sigma-70 family)
MAPIRLDDVDLERIDELGDGSEALMRMLEELPEDQREAVRARVLEERPYEEIAGRLSCSAAVVRQRVSRGLARLRDQLGEEAR